VTGISVDPSACANGQVRVPASNLVGSEGGALRCMMRNLEIERLCLAAMSCGIARRCVEVRVAPPCALALVGSCPPCTGLRTERALTLSSHGAGDGPLQQPTVRLCQAPSRLRTDPGAAMLCNARAVLRAVMLALVHSRFPLSVRLASCCRSPVFALRPPPHIPFSLSQKLALLAASDR